MKRLEDSCKTVSYLVRTSATHHYSSVHPIASYGPPLQAPELCVAEICLPVHAVPKMHALIESSVGGCF